MHTEPSLIYFLQSISMIQYEWNVLSDSIDILPHIIATLVALGRFDHFVSAHKLQQLGLKES